MAPQSSSSRSNVSETTSATPFVVYVSFKFIILTVCSSAFMAFSVGQMARRIILDANGANAVDRIRNDVLGAYRGDGLEGKGMLLHQEVQQSQHGGLPHPRVPNGKNVPRTIYTSKNYDTGRSVTSDSLLARQEQSNNDWVIVPDEEDDEEDEEDEAEHEPAGHHLLIDIEHVDGIFLNTKERLAQAMVELVDLSGLTMLSYHCHGLEPTGVSCAGVLLESHVSFHTWPSPGVITLDLFTCGPNSLVPLVPLIKKLFAIPKTGSTEQPHMLWSYKRRGFREVQGFDAGSMDLYNMFLGVMEFEEKTQLASVQTDFQTVEIYDVIHPRFNSVQAYKKSLLSDGSYESLHPELYRPDRLVYLDGVMQSRRYGDAGYHEALVHPAMFANPDPQTVIIIGGGEGATLREVLKHKSVKKVIMVEIDEKMVNVSRQYLPEWSDCSDFVGCTESCFEDPRVKVVFADAVQWFIDNFSPDNDDKHDELCQSGELDVCHTEGDVDVIIMDALDPGDNVAFSDILFDNYEFAQSLYNSMSDHGIFVFQSGRGDDIGDAAWNNTRFRHSAVFRHKLQDVGFESLADYETSHGGFMGPWGFVVAFVDSDLRTHWFANEAQVNLNIQKRLVGTHSGDFALKYFDGASMQMYHFPSKPVEVVFCRNYPFMYGCNDEHGFNPEVRDIPISAFEVKESLIEGAGRGIFTTVDIPKGSYIAVGEGVHDIHVVPSTYSLIYSFLQAGKNHTVKDKWRFFDAFLYGYGFANFFFGGEDRGIDTGIVKFMNHGCDGSWNVGMDSNVTESNADENDFISEHIWNWEDDVYNPFRDRNIRSLQRTVDVARRDIKAGEEIVDNFLNYASTEKMWKRAVQDLRKQCTKEHLGVITDYEKQ